MEKKETDRCKGCPQYDGFGCSRSPIVTEGEEKFPCDKEDKSVTKQ